MQLVIIRLLLHQKEEKFGSNKRILDFLGVEIGKNISLGDRDFLLSNTIVNEPDRGSSSFAFAPRAIINSLDLEETNVIKPGSRVRYMYLFKARTKKLRNFRKSFSKY